jgi:nucleotide-binding universal stress UspA family protein
MSPRIIVSYDDTDNDRDALALGRLLAISGGDLSLAYVRHAHEDAEDREAQEEEHAEQLLERGAESIGAPDTPRHVIFHASTGEGLIELAERENADVVVFGSDYRTPAGSVTPGTSAQRLLTSGPTAVAIAPADLRSRSSVRIARIGVLDEGDPAADETARSLASALSAEVTEPGTGPVDLLVIGSREGTPAGRVGLSASAEYAIETSAAPVIVAPRGDAVQFASASQASAHATV